MKDKNLSLKDRMIIEAICIREENPLWSIESIQNRLGKLFGLKPTLPVLRKWIRDARRPAA